MGGPPVEPQTLGGGGRAVWYTHDSSPMNKTNATLFNISDPETK